MPLTNIVPTSIAKRTLASVALGIGVVIVVITAISYYYVLSTVTDQSLQGLDKYISERVEREQTIFAIALANQESLKQELLFRLKEFGKTDPAKQFNRLFELFPDGTTRSRLKGFDGTREGFVFIDRKVVIDADIRRRVLTFLELSNEYGPAWHHLLQNVYFTTPENILVGYWPEVPTWAHDVDPELYMPDEEYVWVADMEHNPERKSVWTSLFYDTTGKIWMVSLETPVDLNGRQIATIGHDIPLEQLIDRTINNRLEGTHNFIISGDGHLIAHPEMMQELENKKDHLHLDDSDNEYLKDAFALIKKRGVNDKVIDFSAYDQYLAIAKIKGPDWFFVTVYPKKLVTGIAFRAAQFILFLGIASLLIELLIIAWIFRKNIARPLAELVEATEQVSGGNLSIRLNPNANDELGRLAASFNAMTRSVANRSAELIESEKRFSGILALAPEAIISVDKEGFIRLFNRGAEDVFGYKASDMLGKALEILIPERFRTDHHKHLERFISSPETSLLMSRRGEITGLRKGGEEFPAEASITKLESGGETILTVMLHDVSERKKTEEHLNRTQKMEALGNLTGGVAHEFNNLLMAILGNLEMIDEEITNNESVRRKLSVAMEGALRGKDLTKQLLSYSRKGAHHSQLTDLNEAVSRSCRMFNQALIETIKVETKIDPDLWPVMIDAGELEGVLLNLAINARDAMAQDGTITIETANKKLTQKAAATLPELKPGDYVTLSVTDTGCGISPDVMPHVFDPFFTTKEVGKGTGLGLSMVLGFAKQAGGTVEIESKVSQGTTVRLYLPKASAVARDAAKPANNKLPKETQDLPTGTETILCVEDDPVVLMIGTTMLKGLGYKVLFAEDGPSGLATLKGEQHIDLLLTDVVMPGGMRGTELAKQALAMHPHIKVILATGYNPEEVEKSINGEMRLPLIEKPFRKRELAFKVREILDSAS